MLLSDGFVDRASLTFRPGGKSVVPSIEAKLHCIFHYFCRVTTRMPEGKLTFHRRVVDKDISWCEAALPVLNVQMDAEKPIEDAERCIQVDFAAAGVGGGVLGRGTAQVCLYRINACDPLLS